MRMHTQTPVTIDHRIYSTLWGHPTKEHLPAPEGWLDKAASTISHHLTQQGE